MLGDHCYDIPGKINDGYWITVGWPQRIEAIYDKILKKLEALKVRFDSATYRPPNATFWFTCDYVKS